MLKFCAHSGGILGDRAQDIRCVGFGIDRFVHLLDRAIAPDHVGHALGIFKAVHFPGYIISIGDRPIGVSQQRKRQIEFVGKGLVRGFVIHAHAKYGDALVEVLLVVVAETASFLGAAGGIILGIEVQDNGFARVICELDRIAVGVFDGEIGGLSADRKSHSRS